MLKNIVKSAYISKNLYSKVSIANFSISANKLNKEDAPRVLITGILSLIFKLNIKFYNDYYWKGGLGQIGVALASVLRKKYGVQNIVLSDIKKPSKEIRNTGPFVYADILNYQSLNDIIVNHDINWVIHLSAILSAIGENNVPLAMRINIEGMHNILELSKLHKLRVFIPSTIGAFGSETPRDPVTPDVTIQKPKTIYGISKVHMELLGDYYFHKYNLDFRCLRLPSIVSAINPGLGGTAVYAVEIFHHAVQKGSYECYLKPDTRLPMMYMDDCVDAIVKFIEQPQSKLTQRVYNIQACSFTPGELEKELKKLLPELKVTYKIDSRQQIGE